MAATLLVTAACSTPTYVAVGTYTEKGASVSGLAKGIYIYKFDARTGRLSEVAQSPATPNPSYLAVDARKRRIYVANELLEGQVTTFAYNRQMTQITALGTSPTLGQHPCYVSLAAGGKMALAAN